MGSYFIYPYTNTLCTSLPIFSYILTEIELYAHQVKCFPNLISELGQSSCNLHSAYMRGVWNHTEYSQSILNTVVKINRKIWDQYNFFSNQNKSYVEIISFLYPSLYDSWSFSFLISLKKNDKFLYLVIIYF